MFAFFLSFGVLSI